MQCVKIDKLLCLFLILSVSAMVLYMALLSSYSPFTFLSSAPSNAHDDENTTQSPKAPGLEASSRKRIQQKRTKPNVQKKTKPNVQKKTKPNVQKKTEPNVQKKTKPNVQKKTEPNVQKKTEPNVQKKTEPNVQKKTEPNVQKKTKPNKNIKKARAEQVSVLQGNVSSVMGASKGQAQSPALSKKYLFYMCHPRQICGGWSDRQRGMVSVYILSLVTDRQFGLRMTNPCNVTHFYLPNEVNWDIPAAELVNKTSVVIGDMGSRGGVMNLLRTGDFNERYPQDVVYIKTNSAKYQIALRKNWRYKRRLPAWAKSSMATLFETAWKSLMRPSPFLQHRLEGYLQRIGYENRTHPLVGSHVRIGRSETLKADGRTRMKVSDVINLWNFVEKYVKNGSKLFLATDNLEVRNMSRQRFGASATDTGGSIVHVDRPGGVRDVCEGFGYAVLDQLILSKCDVLILTASGFGQRAAFISGKKTGLFDFTGTEVKHRPA